MKNSQKLLFLCTVIASFSTIDAMFCNRKKVRFNDNITFSDDKPALILKKYPALWQTNEERSNAMKEHQKELGITNEEGCMLDEDRKLGQKAKVKSMRGTWYHFPSNKQYIEDIFIGVQIITVTIASYYIYNELNKKESYPDQNL